MSSLLQYRVLTGPTAAGKTDWLVRRAATRPLAVISADSRQIYRGMDIGTGKPSLSEQAAAPHLGLDLLQPDQAYSAFQFLCDTAAYLDQLCSFEGEIWISGGTGLYLRTILEPLELGAAPSTDLRAGLQAEIARVGARAYAAGHGLQVVDPDNPVRVLRAAERKYGSANEPDLAVLAGLRQRLSAWSCQSIAVLDPGRTELLERIERRVARMFELGLVEETAGLVTAGFGETPVVRNGIGYAEARAVLDGRLELPAAVERTIERTRQYAKRQRTYFRGRQWPVMTQGELASL